MPIAIAPEIGSSLITLTSPNGSMATFNVPTDPNYVGMVTEFTGIDSPEIREEAENRPAADGGLHGRFLFGRRPITLTGKLISPTSTTDRRNKLDKLQRTVLDCMRGDGTLTWTSGSQSVFVKVRIQQPLRITGAWVKDFQVALVAADPRILSTNVVTTALSTSGGTVVVTNEGSAPAFGVITVTGIFNNPLGLNNTTVGANWSANFTATGGGDSTVVNMTNKTVTLNGASQYAAVSTASVWWGLNPGANSILVTSSSATTGSSVSFVHNHAWY